MLLGARINYVFSFVFDALPFSQHVRAAGRNVSLGECLRNKLSETEAYHYPPLGIEYHMAEEKEPPQARSALYLQFPHLSIDTVTRGVAIEGVGSVQVYCHLALFESGMGMVWVGIEVDHELEDEKLRELAQRGSHPLLVTDVGEQEERLSVHQLFFREVDHLRRAVQGALGQLEPADQKRLVRHPRQWNATERRIAVRWFEVDPAETSDIIWRDRETLSKAARAATPDGVFQEPYVVLVLKVAQADREMLDILGPRGAPMFRRVFGILHNIPEQWVDPSHGQGRPEMLLSNLFPDRRFKTYLHSNCLVVVHSEDQSSGEMKDFLRGLFRTFVAFRSVWHYYALTNEQLDNAIDVLSRQFLDILGTRSRSPDALARLRQTRQEIAEARGRFLRCMAVEDPLVRSVGMTPFAAIYEEGSKTMRLAELREVVGLKLRELDNLYSMVNSYVLRQGPPPRTWLRILLGLGIPVIFLWGAGAFLWFKVIKEAEGWTQPLTVWGVGVAASVVVFVVFLVAWLLIRSFLSRLFTH